MRTVRRVLVGLRETGVRRVLYMPAPLVLYLPIGRLPARKPGGVDPVAGVIRLGAVPRVIWDDSGAGPISLVKEMQGKPTPGNRFTSDLRRQASRRPLPHPMRVPSFRCQTGRGSTM